VAYIPLSQRVADAISQRDAAKSEQPAFQWDTPERIRNMAMPRSTPKTDNGHRMSMAQAMRELRKLKRTPR
jgi:hypothetical protein